MPLTHCHAVAAHARLDVPDWAMSGLMLDRALDAILRRITLDRSHDVPYLAGYSQDGRTIYIDRHLPTSFKSGDRTIEVDRYLVMHEVVEKTLIDEMHLHYQHAHQIALRVEEAAVLDDHISWKEYDRFMARYIKEAGDERLERLPPDLDQRPYRDEHDRDLLARMQQAIAEGRLKDQRRKPAGPKKKSGAKAKAKTRTKAKAVRPMSAKGRSAGKTRPQVRTRAKARTKASRR